jgi:hypothetical protein
VLGTQGLQTAYAAEHKRLQHGFRAANANYFCVLPTGCMNTNGIDGAEKSADMRVASESTKRRRSMRLKAMYCVLVLLAGCAQVPRPSTYPYSFQKQMQAADHWHVLARKVVENLMARLRPGDISSTEAIYVQCGGFAQCVSDDRPPFKITPFNQAFHSFLITELTKQGFIAVFAPHDPNDPNIRLKLDWDVQLVVHHADRTTPSLPFGNTLLGGVGFGLGEAWHLLSPEAAGAVTAFGVMPLIDVFQGIRTGPLPHSEVIITTRITKTETMLSHNTIIKREIMHSHDSNVFYINDRDRQHYIGGEPVVQKSYAVVDR